MKYIILDNVTLASARIEAIKATILGVQPMPPTPPITHNDIWLEEYSSLQLSINNQVTGKGAFALIDAISSYYTTDEVSKAVDLSRDWYLLGFRQVIKDISNCPQTGLRRKVILRNLNIDSGEIQNDLSQPVVNQKITGIYNVITLTLDSKVFQKSQDKYITITPLALTQYDYQMGADIYAAVMDKFNSLFP